MLIRLSVGPALAICLIAAALSSAAEPDYSKEPAIIQNLATNVSFSMDGAREWRQTLAVRVQSEAAVRQFGVLSFSYSAENQQISIESVRVKKADGSVVETPASSAMDVTTAVATAAPTYSDLRQKQIPVKGLGLGDVLEYSLRISQRTPEVPGQFWYEETFIDDGVVLNQTLEIRVPKDKYVQVSSPKLRAEIHDDGGDRVYLWKHSHLEPSKPEDKKKETAENQPLKVQLTTFKDWEEVGKWWGTLAAEQAKLTPAIESKAKELTAGLSTDAEKERAIYKYVAMKFRYISISFGEGRYRPHGADEVLANQYGDCKDKHTLFAALLKASGIPAWPALIGAGIKFDSSIPSPAQFNHVITVLPQGGKHLWLDTTAEVAPFGFLIPGIRDEQALVIPVSGKPTLVKTPLDAPFPASEIIDVKSSLGADGTLTGRLDFRMNGDNAVSVRAAFHQLAPTQWQVFAQQMSYALGYRGDVSGVDVENLDELEKPFHYGYSYTRKSFSDWEEHRISPPLPPLALGLNEEAEKPKEPFWIGARGELIYGASVELPKGFSIELPPDAAISSAFADYSAHYSVKNGILFTERKMIIKKAKVGPEQWSEYQKFYKGVRSDQAQFLLISEIGGNQPAIASENNPEAERLVYSAYEAMQKHDLNAARDLLAQAKQLNPKQTLLWAYCAFVEMSSGNNEQAITNYRKEIEYHPAETRSYQDLSRLLIRMGRPDEAIDVYRNALSKKPDDESIAMETAGLLMSARRYVEVPAVLEKPIAAAPEKYFLQAFRAEALLRGGKKDQGVAEAQTIVRATSDPYVLNNLAYALSDTDTALDIAQNLSEKAVNQIEQECAKTNLAGLENSDLGRVRELAAQWDTLGWTYFKRGDLTKAEKYVKASWQLNQHAETGDHLGQIYDKQERHDKAVYIWRLAEAAGGNNEDVKEHLRKTGAPSFEALRLAGSATNTPSISAVEALARLRTVDIPTLPKQTAIAEFFLLASPHGIEDVQFIAGSDALKNAGSAIRTVKLNFSFPDAGLEKIVRRGILSCSLYTSPSCQLTFLLPSTVRKDKGRN
jgi:tetratricopeptide (TPR) repeat protein/transglutaminase-like putative cysteine protease